MICLANRQSPYLLTALLLVLWGSYAAVSKLALHTVATWPFECLSFTVALAALAVPYLLRGGLRRMRALGGRRLLALAAIGIPSFLYYWLYTLALCGTSAVEASVLNYTFPVFVVLFAWPVCGERPSLRAGLGVLLGLCGAAIVLLGGESGGGLGGAGALCALGGAVCWGLFSVLGRRAPGDAQTANVVYMAVGALGSLVGLIVSGQSLTLDAGSAVCILWNGVFSLAMGYLVWFRLLSVAPAALAANLSFLTPFANLLCIALLLREPIRWQHWARLCVILLGVLVQARPGRRSKRVG